MRVIVLNGHKKKATLCETVTFNSKYCYFTSKVAVGAH